MRFTPSEECQVLKGKVYSYIWAGSPKTCNLYVYNDASGKPGTQAFKTTYMPTHKTWDEIPITSTLTYDTDFWIVIWIPPVGGPNEIMAVSDKSFNYANRNTTKFSSASSWKVGTSSVLSGDLCIRAIVSYTGVEEELSPSEIVVLNQNHPNPFVDGTAISYTLPRKMKVELKIYDVAGKLVRTLVDGVQAPGLKKVVWDRKDAQGKAVHSGVYFYGLKTDTDGSFTKVMVVF